MSNDTKWIIGTAVVLGGLLSAQIAGVNARFDDLNTRIDDLRADLTVRIDNVRADLTARIDDLRTELTTRMDRLEGRIDGMDERLRAVEVALARVDQRLLTIERVVLPAPEPPPQ